MIAAPFETPYVAVIFSSMRTGGDHGYGQAATRMEDLASQQPGYLGLESARDATTGLGITVSYWRDADSARAWKNVAEHRRVQAAGQSTWYESYTVRVATVERDYSWPKD